MTVSEVGVHRDDQGRFPRTDSADEKLTTFLSLIVGAITLVDPGRAVDDNAKSRAKCPWGRKEN